MNNPYDVLGVSQDASNNEIKQAYKEIARKYHPSNYENSPLSDVAEQKMKELDEAYDEILKQRMSVGTSPLNESDENETQRFSGVQTQYPDVRMHIDNDRLDDAMTILEGIPFEVRTAEWYFLKGIVHRKRGWLEEAYNNFKIANDMDPYNEEYKNAFNELSGFKNADENYYGYRRNSKRSVGACSPCNICMSLICLDSCCDCCDGDFCCCC